MSGSKCTEFSSDGTPCQTKLAPFTALWDCLNCAASAAVLPICSTAPFGSSSALLRSSSVPGGANRIYLECYSEEGRTWEHSGGFAFVRCLVLLLQRDNTRLQPGDTFAQGTLTCTLLFFSAGAPLRSLDKWWNISEHSDSELLRRGE